MQHGRKALRRRQGDIEPGTLRAHETQPAVAPGKRTGNVCHSHIGHHCGCIRVTSRHGLGVPGAVAGLRIGHRHDLCVRVLARGHGGARPALDHQEQAHQQAGKATKRITHGNSVIPRRPEGDHFLDRAGAPAGPVRTTAGTSNPAAAARSIRV